MRLRIGLPKLRWVACWGLLWMLAGCSAPRPAPVVERSVVSDAQAYEYHVSKGDTLYSIAWRFEKNYQELARINGISAPYILVPGQQLSLKGSASTRAHAAPAPARSAPAPARSAPPRAGASRSGATTSDEGRPPRPAPVGAVRGWRWPTSGPVSRRYGNGNKGVDYTLVRGAEVRAAAAGEIVYAGGGLRGFRSLVIIKHDPHYLSAYSLDHEIAVREGQALMRGEMLARLNGPGILHFEIRRDGNPVDPAGLIDG